MSIVYFCRLVLDFNGTFSIVINTALCIIDIIVVVVWYLLRYDGNADCNQVEEVT